MFVWDDWQYTRDADEPLPPHFTAGWWMDRRHVKFIYALLMTGLFRRVLEIGCHHGSSTAALVQAAQDGADLEIHLCDPDDSPVLRRVLETYPVKVQWWHRWHRCDSLRVIGQRQWDLVIVDGDHSLQHVSRELGLLLYHEIPTVIAHDVEYRSNPGCDGAVYLGEAMALHPAYQCVVDARPRAGEHTHRGLLLATRREDVCAAALPLWEAMVEQPAGSNPRE